jgi:hypothetical protein
VGEVNATKSFESVRALLPMRNCDMIRAFDQALSVNAVLANEGATEDYVSFFPSFL